MLLTILKVLFPIIDWIFRKLAKDEQSMKDYVVMLEIMNRKGIQSALNRLSAQEQIDAVGKLWDKEKEGK